MLGQPRKYVLSEKKERGIIRVINLENDKTLLVQSEDMEKDIVHIRFMLDMENYPNSSLQQDYTSIGLELFSIEPYKVAGDQDDLAACLKQENAQLEEKGIKLYR